MSARPPRWDDLEIFLATARGGTLAAAANELGVNASTVHRRIAALEADLETRLFHRSRRGYDITTVGEDLLRHAIALEEQVLALSRNVTGRDQTLEGCIRVSTVDDLANTVLVPLFESFRAIHSQVSVDVSIGQNFADLARRQADVAFRFGTRPLGGDVVAKRIGTVAIGLYASRAYLDQRATISSFEELADHAIVRGDEDFAALAMEKLIDRYCHADQIAFRSSSMLTRQAAIRSGIGVGFLSRFAADQDPALVRMDMDLSDLSSSFWLLVHADLRRNARVRAFVDFTYEALRKLQWRFEGTEEL